MSSIIILSLICRTMIRSCKFFHFPISIQTNLYYYNNRTYIRIDRRMKMRRRDIMPTYCTVSRSDKFEFLYEYYYNYKNILSCERSCVIYMIENFMMKYHWDEYCKYYSARNRNNMITRIAECMNKGEVIDFILEDVKLPDNILFSDRKSTRLNSSH